MRLGYALILVISRNTRLWIWTLNLAHFQLRESKLSREEKMGNELHYPLFTSPEYAAFDVVYVKLYLFISKFINTGLNYTRNLIWRHLSKFLLFKVSNFDFWILTVLAPISYHSEISKHIIQSGVKIKRLHH